jgi:16S rRNA (guanine527-N7)-methyltransferase
MVTRETSLRAGLEALGIQAPAEAATRLAEFAALLEKLALPVGLLGPEEIPRLIPRHLLEGAALTRWLPDTGTIIDVGSGAGLPGLTLACLGRRVVLIEPKARGASFLREAVHRLGVDAEVVRVRAEVAARGDLRESADGVTSRALAPPAVALELMLPLVRLGGTATLLVGSEDAGRAGALGAIAATLGGATVRAVRFEVPGAPEARWAMIVPKDRATPRRFPRSTPAMRRAGAGPDVTKVKE